VGDVSELWRFPVKSMLGERLEECHITDRGLVGDRAYAVVDETDGKVASAKNPRKWSRLLELSAAFVDAPVAGAPPPPVAVTFPDGTVRRSDDAEVDGALSDFVGRPVRLTSAAPPQRTLEEVWPDIEGLAPAEFIASTQIGTEEGDEPVSDISMALAAPPGTFFDLAVLHLLTTATLEALRALQPDGDFDVRRYRPNVLVGGEGDGFGENGWVGASLALGGDGAVASVMMPTMRCVMTTLAQPGLARDRRLLTTIARHNRVEISGLGRWACAGAYCGAAGTGTVRVGDPVRLLPH
jgi:uncharacterized protein YcbX